MSARNSEIITTSPYHSRSNGEAERGVQTIKNILKKSESKEDILIGLMEYRNTPTKDLVLSPAQLLQCRRLRSKLPTTISLLKPKINENVNYYMQKKTFNNMRYFNRNIRDREEFKNNQRIYMRKDKVWVPGTIVNKCQTPRSYMIQDENNKSYRRNSQFLRPNFANQYLNSSNERDDFSEQNMKRTRSGRRYN